MLSIEEIISILDAIDVIGKPATVDITEPDLNGMSEGENIRPLK